MADAMTTITADDRSPAMARAAAQQAARERIADDMAMLKIAAEITRDLHAPNPRIYWTDFLLSAAIGYAALAGAILAPVLWAALLCGVVSVLALYRAGLFIHEVSHMKHSAVPGFRTGFNLVAGIPLFVPSFMYEGVHNLHHARTRYGTAEDPEYLPLALMKPWTLPVFVLIAILAPVALLFRYAVLTPLSVVIPSLRRVVVGRYSSLAINPAFVRREPEGEARRYMHRIEAATSIWAITLVALVVTGTLPLRAFLIFLAVVSAVTLINQIRTLVAHLWENEGEVMTVTAQYLDSVNVPPPSLLPLIWAPVGLRYHALHHLVPSVPYHALGEAHRRLSAQLGQGSTYSRAHYPGLFGLVGRLAASTMRSRSAAG